METTEEKKEIYSIDKYQGAGKWCFAIILNRACDNYEGNPHLLSESLLRFEEVNRRDWFDEETRELIIQMDTETKTDPNLKPNTTANRKLNDIRNYFSHFHHTEESLCFKEDSPIRIILENAYKKAKQHHIERLEKETDIEFPALFESNDRITSAGIIFFSSLFVERRILNRLMGYVGGFKKTKGEYNITREIFSTYCLRDSYSIMAADSNAVIFRDILGYLSRVPSEYYKHNKEKCDKENEPERKTKKFIYFALRYLEKFALKEIRNYKVSIARMEVVREETKEAEGEDEQHKPYPNKAKVKIVFDSSRMELPYYINHKTVIMKIKRNGEEVNFCKIGINELKYLVLLCLQGKSVDAIAKINGYINRIKKRFENPKTRIDFDSERDNEFIQGLPEFVKIHSGRTPDKEKEIKSRIDYIRKKWDKKKEESLNTELHRKGRDILRYINWHCEPPLGSEEYNHLLALLINKDLDAFESELKELKRTEQISKQLLEILQGFSNLNELHLKVCYIVLEELKYLAKNDPGKMAEYIGLARTPDERAPSYEEKVKTFVKQPMIYKGYFRDTFFSSGKTFAKLVEETFLQKYPHSDVPLGKDYYHVTTLDRFHKDNSILYETLALDRLCVVMARKFHETLNQELAKESKQIVWENNTIILELPRSKTSSSDTFQICFDIKHYMKLYVMDDVEFLGGLMRHFFQKEKTIEYHNLYSFGINKYTEMQRNGIEAILRLEEKVIQQKKIPLDGDYVGFKKIIRQSGYRQDEKDILQSIRNSLLHYNLKFEPADYNKFVAIMKREGLERKKKTGKTTRGWVKK